MDSRRDMMLVDAAIAREAGAARPNADAWRKIPPLKLQ
jgi:hypothetical protein